MSSVIEKIRTKPRIGAAVGAALLVVGGIAIWMQTRGASKAFSRGEAFYTTDDGATLFTDSPDRLPPFDHDGKEAVLAGVFSCDKGEHRWVQYLYKYPPETIAEAAQMKALGAKFVSFSADRALVKRPGDKQWVRAADPQTIMTPKCPDGQPGTPIEVHP